MPSDTQEHIKGVRMFLIVNIVIMIGLIGGAIGWLYSAKKNKSWPFEKYVRKTGPPGTHSILDIMHANKGTTSGTSESGVDATTNATPSTSLTTAS